METTPSTKTIYELAELLVKDGLYNEDQAGAVAYALVVLHDFSETIWEKYFPEALAALRDPSLSREDKHVALVDMQVTLREIYLQLHDLDFFFA